MTDRETLKKAAVTAPSKAYSEFAEKCIDDWACLVADLDALPVQERARLYAAIAAQAAGKCSASFEKM